MPQSAVTMTLSFFKTFKNTNYTLILGHSTNQTGSYYTLSERYDQRTTSSCIVYSSQGAAPRYHFNWYACGY